MSHTIDATSIEADLKQLQMELQRMAEQKQRLDAAIVAQQGAISYAELLLGRTAQDVEKAEAPPE